MSMTSPALTHEWIWRAIDGLARRNSLSPSALARLAGLDPTAFNKSKRITSEGRPRWPSTESIAKVLAATGTTLDEFTDLLAVPAEACIAGADLPRTVPIVGEIRSDAVAGIALVDATGVSADASGHAPEAFALAVADTSLEPVYSRGNTLYLSRSEPARSGDRIVLKPRGAHPLPRLLVADTPEHVEISSFGRGRSRQRLERSSIAWIARITWARH